MEKMSQKADIIVAAEIEKEKVEIAAEAEAERIRRIAQGNADAKLKQMQAEALGMYQILEKKADGFRRLVDAAGDSSDMAIKLLLAEQMTDLLGIQANAIKEMKIDQVTVWSGGEGGENGKSSVSGYVHDLFKMLPPLQDILSMKGMGLPEFLTKPGGEEIAAAEVKEESKPVVMKKDEEKKEN